MQVIDNFSNKYEFLSNFADCPNGVLFDGIKYKSSEAAFQAAKCAVFSERKKFENLTPLEAKRLGRKIKLRSDWEEVKHDVMFQIVLTKFVMNPYYGKSLIDTKNAELIEGNHWNDTYWGICCGEGENHLGIILMQVREMINDIMRVNQYD